MEVCGFMVGGERCVGDICKFVLVVYVKCVVFVLVHMLSLCRCA